MSEHEHQQMEDVDDIQVSQPPTIPPPPPVQHPLLHGSWAHDTAGLAAVPEISVPNPEYQIPEDEHFVTVGMIRGLNNKILELKALINGRLPPVDPPPPPPPPPVQTTPSNSTGGGMRFKKPDVFKGKAETVPGFILDIKNTLYLQRSAYRTDCDKSLYLCTYLGDRSPKDFLRPTNATRPELLDNFESFVKAFEDHFGDSNIAKTAMTKIQDLQQLADVSKYCAKINEWIIHCDMNDATQIFWFYDGLTETLKDKICDRNDAPPDSLKKYQDWVIKIDNRQREGEKERQRAARKNGTNGKNGNNSNGHTNGSTNGNSKKTPRTLSFVPNTTTVPGASPTSKPSSSSNDLPAGDPMEIDSITTRPRGPLTQAERDRRRLAGLCIYCGRGGHRISSCPNMSEAAKKAYSDRMKKAGKA